MQEIIRKAKEKLKGGARTNFYKLDIVFPFATPDIDESSHILITSTQVPAIKSGSPLTINLVYGKQVKLASSMRIFDPFTGTIVNDVDMTYRKYFEQWIDLIQSWNDNEGALPEEYETTVTLTLLANDGKTEKRKYKMYYCFPEVTDAISLGSDGEDIQKFNFTLHYTGIEVIDD